MHEKVKRKTVTKELEIFQKTHTNIEEKRHVCFINMSFNVDYKDEISNPPENEIRFIPL